MAVSRLEVQRVRVLNSGAIRLVRIDLHSYLFYFLPPPRWVCRGFGRSWRQSGAQFSEKSYTSVWQELTSTLTKAGKYGGQEDGD